MHEFTQPIAVSAARLYERHDCKKAHRAHRRCDGARFRTTCSQSEALLHDAKGGESVSLLGGVHDSIATELGLFSAAIQFRISHPSLAATACVSDVRARGRSLKIVV